MSAILIFSPQTNRYISRRVPVGKGGGGHPLGVIGGGGRLPSAFDIYLVFGFEWYDF